MAGSHARRMPASEVFAGVRFDRGEARATEDAIANETAVALVYNGRPHAVMMATPADLEDFALGFSVSEGIVAGAADVLGVRMRVLDDGIEANVEIADDRFRALDARQRNLTGRIGCGLCGAETIAQAIRHPAPVERDLRLAPEAIARGMAALAAKQPLNAATGAVHAAAWMDAEGRVRVVREDVGRHNALDKLIGALLRDGIDPGGGAVLITSRASYEIVQKAAIAGIPVVCAISAPTGLAIRLADEAGVTLVAFARGESHTVYAHERRIAAPVGSIAA